MINIVFFILNISLFPYIDQHKNQERWGKSFLFKQSEFLQKPDGRGHSSQLQ